MGEVDYFLATAFNWLHHNDDNIFVHSSQSAFIRHTALHFCVNKHNKFPDMTPYCSGLSIEDIPQPEKWMLISNAALNSTKALLIPSTGWLNALNLKPDFTPILTLIAFTKIYPISNTTMTLFVLSSISQVQVNILSLATPAHA